jgi:hypothetical protein
MTLWNALECIAWAASAIVFMWMVFDGWRVGQSHSEDVLLSSREGVDELIPEKKGG